MITTLPNAQLFEQPVNALSLEYQMEYGCARRDLDVSDLINNPLVSGKCRILSLSFDEETFKFYRS